MKMNSSALSLGGGHGSRRNGQVAAGPSLHFLLERFWRWRLQVFPLLQSFLLVESQAQHLVETEQAVGLRDSGLARPFPQEERE